MGLKIHKLTDTRAEGMLDGVIPCLFEMTEGEFSARIGNGFWQRKSEIKAVTARGVPSIREMRMAIYNSIAAYRNDMRPTAPGLA
ncbi:hypothetical protein ACEUZ9_000921 [Paracoccus litorisediminis]|uniref:hypothetical protein n=1 Tax=Paracoccus litorisediminis TaxID=2006130 RepID=UPI00373002BF